MKRMSMKTESDADDADDADEDDADDADDDDDKDRIIGAADEGGDADRLTIDEYEY